MKKTYLLIVFLVSLLAACTPAASGCTLNFQAAVRQGPSAGLSVAGDLTWQIRQSNIEGRLVREDGSEARVTGQADERAIHMVIELDGDNVLLGVGTSQQDIRECRGSLGGSLVGPQPGDSGDWYGRFAVGQPAGVLSMLSLPVVLIVCLLLFAVLGLVILRRLGYSGKKSATPSWVSASSQVVEPEAWPGQAGKPLAQFVTTYTLGDDHYDVSFSIKTGSDFMGECGAGISHTLGAGKPKQATALEVWIFDKNDINTITRVLMSEYCYSNEAQRASLAHKGQALLIQPGMNVELETKTLRLLAHVAELDYGAGGLPKSYFNKVTLKLAVWAR